LEETETPYFDKATLETKLGLGSHKVRHINSDSYFQSAEDNTNAAAFPPH